MITKPQCHLQGKHFQIILNFIVHRFNSIHIPKTDDTLHSTSRRYGTRTLPNTHPANHAHYKSNETTFRASYINPKMHPSQVYRTRNPEVEFS